MAVDGNRNGSGRLAWFYTRSGSGKRASQVAIGKYARINLLNGWASREMVRFTPAGETSRFCWPALRVARRHLA